MKIKRTAIPTLVLALVCLSSTPSLAGPILYGGLGGHSNGDSTNDGAVGTVNQTTGAVSIVGHPAAVSRISGLAFDSLGNLFGTTLGPGGFPPPPGPTTVSNLIHIDPDTAALISSIAVTVGGVGVSIADLAMQPGTNILFGLRSPGDQGGGEGLLYTINKTTGVATLVGNTGDFFGSIAFAPNGTLYMSAADLDFATGNLINSALKTLNPNNAAVLTTVPTIDFFGGLGIRPDGVIFGDTGDSSLLMTINPLNGAETLVGNTGRNFVGDLAFQPVAVPEPASLSLLGAGLAAFVARRRRQRRSQM